MPTQPPVVAPGYVAPFVEPIAPARANVLAERLHRLLDGGTPRPDSKYQRRELLLHILSAYTAQQGEVLFRNAQALQQDYLLRQKMEKEWYFDDLRAQSELGGTVDEFIYPYVVPVLVDTTTDRDYADLPEEFLTLKRYGNLPGESIQDVQPLTRKDRLTMPFVPLRGSQESLLAGLFKGGLGGKLTWSRRSTRVFFDHDPGCPRASARFDQVELLLVMRRRKAGELPEPALLQAAQDFDILARAQKLALKVVPEDKINDNNAVAQ